MSREDLSLFSKLGFVFSRKASSFEREVLELFRLGRKKTDGTTLRIVFPCLETIFQRIGARVVTLSVALFYHLMTVDDLSKCHLHLLGEAVMEWCQDGLFH
jgi:hypothetical protein